MKLLKSNYLLRSNGLEHRFCSLALFFFWKINKSSGYYSLKRKQNMKINVHFPQYPCFSLVQQEEPGRGDEGFGLCRLKP